MRKQSLKEGHFYHIFTKSIAEYRIFNSAEEFSRMINVIRYYQNEKPEIRFSQFIKLSKKAQDIYNKNFGTESVKLIDIIAYCLMPTHLHLILKQTKHRGISIFMNNILNSYTRYFNVKHRRKGPLWEGRFKSVLVASDEQLLHLTRYLHLNPVTAYLVEKSEDWPASSYAEYLTKTGKGHKLCDYDAVLDIKPDTYRAFVEDGISYQRELAKIKSFLFEPTHTA